MFYVCDSYSNKIRRINSTGFTTTFAGNGSAGSINGPGLSSTFYVPESIVFDSVTGNLTVIPGVDRPLRRITPDGTVSLFAATGNSQLSAIVVDNSPNYYVFNMDTYCGA